MKIKKNGVFLLLAGILTVSSATAADHWQHSNNGGSSYNYLDSQNELLVGQFSEECKNHSCFDLIQADQRILRAKRHSMTGFAINLSFEDAEGNPLGSIEENRNWKSQVLSFTMFDQNHDPIAHGFYEKDQSVSLKAPDGVLFGQLSHSEEKSEILLTGEVPPSFDQKWILALTAIQTRNPLITRNRVIAVVTGTAVVVAGAAIGITYKFRRKSKAEIFPKGMVPTELPTIDGTQIFGLSERPLPGAGTRAPAFTVRPTHRADREQPIAPVSLMYQGSYHL